MLCIIIESLIVSRLKTLIVHVARVYVTPQHVNVIQMVEIEKIIKSCC